MKQIFLLFALAGSCLATGNVCTSTATGNWNAAGTWINCGGTFPGDGDVALIANTHNVTIPVGVTAIVGISGTNLFTTHTIASLTNGTPALSCTADNGSGILTINGTLQFRGHVSVCNATWTGNAGAAIVHDSSLAADPTNTHYRFVIGMAFRPTSLLRLSGTVGNRVTVSNFSGSGTFYGFFPDGNGSTQNAGQFDFNYVNLTGCTGGTYCIQGTAYSNGSNKFICNYCFFDAAKPVRVDEQGVAANNVIKFDHSTFINSTAVVQLYLLPTANSTATWTLSNSYLNGQLNYSQNGTASNFTLSNVFLRADKDINNLDNGGTTGRIGGTDLVMRFMDAGNNKYGYLPGGNHTRVMCGVNKASNPFCFNVPTNSGANADTITGVVADQIGASSDGDLFFGNPSLSLALSNVLVACNSSTGYSLGLETMFIPASTKTVTLANSTYCGRFNGGTGGMGFENAGTASAGMIPSVQNNIVFCATSTSCYLVHPGATGTAVAGTFTNVDYNWKYNVGTGPYSGAFEWNSIVAYTVGQRVLYSDGHTYASILNGTNKIPPSQPLYWILTDDEFATPNPPGTNDSSGDPYFVEQRHILQWGQSLDPTITTWTQIGDKFAAMNDDSGYDPRFNLADLYNWMRAGYRPRNPSVSTAGNSGVPVGAITLDYAFQTTPSGTVYTWKPGALTNQGQ